MHPADKAVLRLAIGLGLAVLVAYGLALPLPFVSCVLAVVLLCKPGPPMPFVKGVVAGAVVAGLLVGGRADGAAAGALRAAPASLLTGAAALRACSSPARARPIR